MALLVELVLELQAGIVRLGPRMDSTSHPFRRILFLLAQNKFMRSSMSRPSLRAVLSSLLLLTVAATGLLSAQNVKITHTSLKPGDMAPDFTLLDHHWNPVRLSDFRGKKNVVLAFYVLAFSEG
jgi:hypothetical protein